MDIDLSQYMGMYIDGSKENLDLMDKQLLALEENPENIESINEIFRAAHTLKGMSATMGFSRVTHVTHEMESVLDRLRNREVQLTTPIIDILFETFDLLRTLVNDTINTTDSEVDTDSVLRKLDALTQPSASIIKPAGSSEFKPMSLPGDDSPSEDTLEDIDRIIPEMSDVQINEYEMQVLLEAAHQKHSIFLMIVTLTHDCLLKAPRAFMVCRTLEEFRCDIIKSLPEIKDIEEENFDLSFKMLVIGPIRPSELKKEIETISEIDSIKMIDLTPQDFINQAMQNSEPPPRSVQTLEPPKTVIPASVPSVSASQKPQVESLPTRQPSQTQAPPRAAVPQPSASAPVLNKMPAKPPPQPLKKAPVVHSHDRRPSQTVRVDMYRLDELMNLVGELVINRTRLDEISTTHKLKSLNEALSRVSQISSSLQSVVMQVRMVPIEQIFDRFPRMVRDLSKKLDKKINLVLEGKETEMDRTVIDEIGDPMVHLIRNAIDHGIESSSERIARGKSDVGTITLVARHEGNNVIIEVKDDGKGVDPTVVARLAVERGLLTTEQVAKMPPEEIIKIIFMPGFSTSNQVSDLSGRGVGMDAVKSKLEDLNGQLEIESKVGEGSRIAIKLPLTLAILPALMVKVGLEAFAIPLGMVQETIDINESDINIVQHQEVTLLRGELLPIIRLREALMVPTQNEKTELEEKEEDLSVVVCSSGERRAGFMVDELYGQQEIVIKSLGNLLGGLPGIMGATMRGDGSIALILDIPSFLQKGQTIA